MPFILQRTSLPAVSLGALLASAGVLAAQSTTTDLFVPHESTLRANEGQLIPLHVRHKTPGTENAEIAPENRVVLFVHGGTVPVVPAYDLDFEDYSWMGFLADAGFNVWGMDLTGYGSSDRPMMDNPCNANPEQQELLVGTTLEVACTPHFAYQTQTLADEWAQIDSVVDHIREQTGAERVSLAGWSAGGPRLGGYVSENPDKVNRVVLYAPSPPVDDAEVVQETEEGAPINLQNRDTLINGRWAGDVRCEGQLDTAVHDPLWNEIMAWDRIGSGWGEDGLMRSPSRTRADLPTMMLREVEAPLLVMTGEFDRPDERRTFYDQAGSTDKVLIQAACASHFVPYEKPRKVLHDASLEWLRDGTFQGETSGVFNVDADLNVSAAE